MYITTRLLFALLTFFFFVLISTQSNADTLKVNMLESSDMENSDRICNQIFTTEKVL